MGIPLTKSNCNYFFTRTIVEGSSFNSSNFMFYGRLSGTCDVFTTINEKSALNEFLQFPASLIVNFRCT